MDTDGRKRVIIENVTPQIDAGQFPVKRTIGEKVFVQADVFVDGHDEISAMLFYRCESDDSWNEVTMRPLGNDRWEGVFVIDTMQPYIYKVGGWIDHFSTWQRSLEKKYSAGQDILIELQIGTKLILTCAKQAPALEKKSLEEFSDQLVSKNKSSAFTYAFNNELTALMHKNADRTLSSESTLFKISVERKKALFSTWYELFPRSCNDGMHGTFTDCTQLLPKIAAMGFDVLYLPPIHPIGVSHRKGKNNTTSCGPDDPGSPWAIGSEQGGHMAINPALGTLSDFEKLVSQAGTNGIEIALDIAFQCSPDHPYVHKHPEWFKKRPDGTIQYAENPPKKYEDIVPFDFECLAWESLWKELKSVIEFWIAKGITIFRIDNPHTKAFPFWEWLITEIRKIHPGILFLAEAFTRPRVMQHLAKIGFSQSYTYFTWRNTKPEIVAYMTELTSYPLKEYFRPNFWPNTPDILPEYLQYGGKAAFIVRLALAATLSSNYGIYGPAYEHCVSDALPDKEEYADSEKFEIKKWNWDHPGSLNAMITRLNKIRRENDALQTMDGISFQHIDNDSLLFFMRHTTDLSNVLLIVVNLDPFNKQSGWLYVPDRELGIPSKQTYLVHDLISNDKYIWHESKNFIELDPTMVPIHIFRLHRTLRRETDFDYYL